MSILFRRCTLMGIKPRMRSNRQAPADAQAIPKDRKGSVHPYRVLPEMREKVMRVKCHPTLGILVCTDGHVMVPANGSKKAHWTFGCKDRYGYLRVKINGRPYRVHRLVLEAFVGPCPEGFECDHSNRDRHNNALTNLRWLSHTQNLRNTSANDRVESRGGTHKYQDVRRYSREYSHLHYRKNKQYYKERNVRYNKTHKNVCFSDGKKRWIPNEQAIELLKLPIKERVYGRKNTQ